MIWFYFDWISKQKYKVVLLLLLLYYHPVNCYLLSFKFRVIQLCSQRSTRSELNWSIIPFSIICELAAFFPPSHHTHTVYTVYSAHFKWKSLLDLGGKTNREFSDVASFSSLKASSWISFHSIFWHFLKPSNCHEICTKLEMTWQ